MKQEFDPDYIRRTIQERIHEYHKLHKCSPTRLYLDINSFKILEEDSPIDVRSKERWSSGYEAECYGLKVYPVLTRLGVYERSHPEYATSHIEVG